MLSLMRKKAGSWLIKVILSIIVIVFVFWGVGSYRNRQATQVADINGTIITFDAYRQAYQRLLEQYRRVYGSQLNNDLLKMLRLNEVALDQMVNRILMLQEAHRLGLQTTEQEIADAIHQIPAFQRNGTFDFNLYSSLLARNNIGTEEFERDQEESILIGLLNAVILDGVTVSEADARQWYDWQNAQVNLTYLLFSPERYQDISPSDEQIASYYEKHKSDYLTEAQVKVRYLFFDPKAYEADVDVSEEEISRYYHGHADEFHSEKSVQARHILFKLEPDADEETIEKQHQKALEIYELAKKGQSFAELAKQYSEGPSRDNGGDLGTFTRDNMVKPFADRAFSMAAGDISEPVRTQFGWHIIKVEKVNPAFTESLEDASEDIKNDLMARKARELALEKAESIYDSLFDGDNLSMIEKDEQIIAGTTDFFSAQNPPEIAVANAREFADAAMALDETAISTILDLESGYYLLQAVDRIEPAVPPLEDVYGRVKADVVSQLQSEKAKADAQAALESLKNKETFGDVAGHYGLEVRETGYFSRNGAIPDIGFEQELNRLGFTLSAAMPLAQEITQVSRGWLVFELKERKNADGQAFDKEKADIVARLTDQKKQATLKTWLDDLKSRGVVEINYDLIK